MGSVRVCDQQLMRAAFRRGHGKVNEHNLPPGCFAQMPLGRAQGRLRCATSQASWECGMRRATRDFSARRMPSISLTVSSRRPFSLTTTAGGRGRHFGGVSQEDRTPACKTSVNFVERSGRNCIRLLLQCELNGRNVAQYSTMSRSFGRLLEIQLPEGTAQ